MNEDTDIAMDIIATQRGIRSLGIKSVECSVRDAKALDHFSKLKGFQRAWCMQEVAVNSEDPLLVCGNRTARWSDLMDTLLFNLPADAPNDDYCHVNGDLAVQVEAYRQARIFYQQSLATLLQTCA